MPEYKGTKKPPRSSKRIIVIYEGETKGICFHKRGGKSYRINETAYHQGA